MNTDCLEAYRKDQRHPYYSLQGKSWRERKQAWTWGHFAAALRRALESKIIRVENWQRR